MGCSSPSCHPHTGCLKWYRYAVEASTGYENADIDQAECTRDLAQVYRVQRRVPDAIEHYEQAARLFRAIHFTIEADICDAWKTRLQELQRYRGGKQKHYQMKLQP